MIGAETVSAGLDANPGHPYDLVVNHKSQGVGQVRLVSHSLKGVLMAFGVGKGSILEKGTQLVHILGQARVDLQECCLVLLVVHHRGLVLDEFHSLDRHGSHSTMLLSCPASLDPLVQLIFDSLQVIRPKWLRHRSHVHLHVEVGSEVVHVNRHRVLPRRDTEHADYWSLLVGQSVPDVHRRDRSVVVSVNLHEHEIVLAGINVHGGRSPHLLLP